MNTVPKSNNLVKMSMAVFAVLLLMPLGLIVNKIATEYGHLKDVRFQGERLLSQQMTSETTLAAQAKDADFLRAELTPLSGTASQANAQLQTKIRKMISKSGGTVETISGGSTSQKTRDDETLIPISVNVRWNVSEQGMGEFLALLARPGQNLSLGNLNIRRRQGTGSLLDVRISIAALWQDAPQVGTKEGK